MFPLSYMSIPASLIYLIVILMFTESGPKNIPELMYQNNMVHPLHNTHEINAYCKNPIEGSLSVRCQFHTFPVLFCA